MTGHFLRMAYRGAREAEEECKNLAAQIVRHRRTGNSTSMLELELIKATERKKDALARERVQAHMDRP